MSDTKAMLEARAARKRRKPTFLMQDVHKKPKLGQKWRMPRGLDSKIRLGLNGYRKKPTQGYRSPKAVRGFSKRGLIQNVVATVAAIADLDPKKDGIILSRTLSKLSKYRLVKECQENGFTIINVADPQGYIKAFDEAQQKKKALKEEKAKSKEKKKDALKKKADKKEADDKADDKVEDKVEDKADGKTEAKEEAKEEKSDEAKKETPKRPTEGTSAAPVKEKQEKKDIDKILSKKDSL